MGLQLVYVWQFWQGEYMGPCGLVTLACGPPTLGRGLSVGDCPFSAGCCTAMPVSSGSSAMPIVRSQRLRFIIHSMPFKMPRISQVQDRLPMNSRQTTSTRLAFGRPCDFAHRETAVTFHAQGNSGLNSRFFQESSVLIHVSNLLADVSCGRPFRCWPLFRKMCSSEATKWINPEIVQL